jgi:hypothetical protein
MDKVGFQHSFSQLQNHVHNGNSLRALLNEWFYDYTDQAHYSKMLNAIMDFITNVGIVGITGSDARIIIVNSDGKVGLDTSKSNNSFQNYRDGLINENHNSRVAIMSALLSNSGVAFEEKLSGTNRRYENYMAVRVGAGATNSAGVIRLSYVGNEFTTTGNQ